MSIGTDAHRTFRGFRMVPDRLWLDPRLKANDVRVWCALCFTARGRDHRLTGFSPREPRHFSGGGGAIFGGFSPSPC